MKHLFYLITTALLFLASCDSNIHPTTPKVPQREGIQWGEFIFGEINAWDAVEEFRLPYLTADGLADTLSCVLPYSMPKSDINSIFEDDINFDSIPDVQIILGNQNWWGNTIYEGFVWDKEKGCFTYVDNYRDIFSPEIHSDSLYILGTDYFSFEGHYTVTYTKYQWIDGVLTETDSWSDHGSTWGDEEEDEEE